MLGRSSVIDGDNVDASESGEASACAVMGVEISEYETSAVDVDARGAGSRGVMSVNAHGYGSRAVGGEKEIVHLWNLWPGRPESLLSQHGQ